MWKGRKEGGKKEGEKGLQGEFLFNLCPLPPLLSLLKIMGWPVCESYHFRMRQRLDVSRLGGVVWSGEEFKNHK